MGTSYKAPKEETSELIAQVTGMGGGTLWGLGSGDLSPSASLATNQLQD